MLAPVPVNGWLDMYACCQHVGARNANEPQPTIIITGMQAEYMAAVRRTCGKPTPAHTKTPTYIHSHTRTVMHIDTL
jgi:hypothetical protein